MRTRGLWDCMLRVAMHSHAKVGLGMELKLFENLELWKLFEN